MVVYLSAADRVVIISIITTLRRAATNATTNTITNVCLDRLWVIQLCMSGDVKGGGKANCGRVRKGGCAGHSTFFLPAARTVFLDGRLFIRHRTLKIGMSIVLIACLFRAMQGRMLHAKGCKG